MCPLAVLWIGNDLRSPSVHHMLGLGFTRLLLHGQSEGQQKMLVSQKH